MKMRFPKFFLALCLVCLSVANLALADGPRTLKVSDPYALPFRIGDEPAFLPAERYQPVYFCKLTNTPLSLPSPPEDQSFQMIEGMLGISWDKAEKRYLLKQLKVFQNQKADGTLSVRQTKRIFVFPEGPSQDDWSSLHLETDAKAVDSDTERRTILHLDRAKQTGYIQNILWKSPDRTQKPFFDYKYEFKYIPLD